MNLNLRILCFPSLFIIAAEIWHCRPPAIPRPSPRVFGFGIAPLQSVRPSASVTYLAMSAAAAEENMQTRRRGRRSMPMMRNAVVIFVVWRENSSER